MKAAGGPVVFVFALAAPVLAGLLLFGTVTSEGINFGLPGDAVPAVSERAISDFCPAPLAQTVLVRRHPFALELRDLRNGSMIQQLDLEATELLSACQSADGSVLAVATRNGIWYFHLEDDATCGFLGQSQAALPTTALALTSDGALCCSGHDDSVARLWNTRDGALVCELRAESGVGPIGVVQFTSDDCHVISADGSGTVFLWDIEANELAQRLAGGDRRIGALALSADGMRLLAGSTGGTVSLWDLEAGTRLWSVRLSRDAIADVAITPDGQSVFAACQKSICSLDASSGRTVATMNGHARVNSLAVGAEGRTLLSGSADGTVRTWDMRSGQELCQVW